MENGRYPQACCSGKHAPLQRKGTEKEVFVILPIQVQKNHYKDLFSSGIYALVYLCLRFLLIKYILEKNLKSRWFAVKALENTLICLPKF